MTQVSPPIPLLIICGPTATGKTALALQVGQVIPAAIISADSRQVYRGMDIGTGKDIPAGAVKRNSSLSFNDHQITYYQTKHASIWGYDLVDPWQAFSSAQYVNHAHKIIKYVYSQNRLPIVVGGTGCYISSLLNRPQTYGIPVNPPLRIKLAAGTVKQLQSQLQQLSLEKWRSMNDSDRQNPRRLIRAIEVAKHDKQHKPHTQKTKLNPTYQPFCIGLHVSSDRLKDKIRHRVYARATSDFTHEVNRLRKHPLWDLTSPAASALGYREWLNYLDGQTDRKGAVNNWITHEMQYAKRQMTWFKKESQIHWFDATIPLLHHQVVARVKSWYATGI